MKGFYLGASKTIGAGVMGLLALLSVGAASAEAGAKGEQVDAEAFIRETLGKTFPVPVESVKPTPIEGLYEVIAGGQIGYFSADMKYVISGDLIEYATNTNITDAKRGDIRAKVMGDISENSYIAFKPKGKTDHIINVFTDVDCGFCRKLHKEVPALNEKGVEVRYFLYPRAGLNTRSAATLESAWCADDPQQALTDAKNGKRIESKKCDHPIKEHMVLANQMGLTGTPLIITGKGTRINGYRPADQIYTTLVGDAAK